MAPVVGSEHPDKLELAKLFSTCVECFGLIHPSKEWDHGQRVVLTKLGIQQGRLLAWGDMNGILYVSEGRNPALDDPAVRPAIEEALNAIIDRPAHVDRETLFEQYGLKPPKKFMVRSQPALDAVRIESFRERLEILQRQRWEVRRGMSITINHWILTDLTKFSAFLSLIKEKIDFLIGLMGVEVQVDTAIKHDIKALAWHPIFEKTKASQDKSKLMLIRESCLEDYPQYAEACTGALAYLDKEWKESYQEAMAGVPNATEIPGAAAYMMAQSKKVAESYGKKKPASSASSGEKRPGFLKIFRPRSWLKPDVAAKGRSQSHTPVPTTGGLTTPPLTPERERSKSVAVPWSENPHLMPVGPGDADALSSTKDGEGHEGGEEDGVGEENVMTKVDTYKSLGGLEGTVPVASLVSRHDHWRSPW